MLPVTATFTAICHENIDAQSRFFAHRLQAGVEEGAGVTLAPKNLVAAATAARESVNPQPPTFN